MNEVLNAIQLVMQYGPKVKEIWDQATSNEEATKMVQSLSPILGTLLGSIGASVFPKAAPALHIVGGIIAGFDPNLTKWLQGSLNKLLSPSPNLDVDGIYGPRTADAVSKLQAKSGLKIDGLAGQITQAAIAAALAKLGAKS